MTTAIKEKDVIEFEQNIGGELPKNYRAAMLKKNGQLFEIDHKEWYLYPLYRQEDCPCCEGEIKGVIESTKELSDVPSYPNNAITFAQDDHGEFLIFYPGHDKYFTWSLESLETNAFSGKSLTFIPIDNPFSAEDTQIWIKAE
jgi:hypothetical protein